MLEALRLDEQALRSLRACCSLRPPRNAAAIVSAIKARLEFSQPKPVQKIEASGKDGQPLTMVVQVISPGEAGA